MKAKLLRRIRKSTDYYMVQKSYGLFGDFDGFGRMYKSIPMRILARNNKEAIYRYQRRYERPDVVPCKYWLQTDMKWATYATIKENEPIRNAKFYR